jgi:hypothetical protein
MGAALLVVAMVDIVCVLILRNKLGGVFVEGGKTVRLQSVKNFK